METPDSVSLAFAVRDSLREEFAFEPGPVSDLARDDRRRGDAGATIRSPSGLDEGELRIAVRRAEGGTFSCFANDVLCAGERIDVAPPEGRFHRRDRRRSPSRIFRPRDRESRPSSRSSARRSPPTLKSARRSFPHGNKTTSSIMFRWRAPRSSSDRYLGRLAVLHVLSRESQDIDILSGRVDGEKIALFARTFLRPSEVDAYYLCGPLGMIEDGRAALIAAGVSRERIKAELFSTDGAPKGRAPVCSGASSKASAMTKSNACSTAAPTASSPSPASASSTRRRNKGSRFRIRAEAACAAPAAASSSRARSRWTSTTRHRALGSSRRAYVLARCESRCAYPEEWEARF